MSQRLWVEPIRQIILTSNRLAFIGVGNELRGDDAVGVQIVQLLRESMPLAENMLFCEAGPAPENFTSLLRRFGPDMALLIDAVQMGAVPGAIRLLDVSTADSYPASTHTLPLKLFARYLKNEMSCSVMLLGIQPMDLSLGASLSSPVRASADDITQTIVALFTPIFSLLPPPDANVT